MEIRSYRRVFDLERRIYRVDRVRLNPGGIPVRGVVYFLAILLASLLLAGLPWLGLALRWLPWYARELALPGLSAALLTVIRIEGRPFHLAAHAVVRFRVGPRTLAGLRACSPAAGASPGEAWRPQSIVMLPDGSESALRRLRYTGPGALLVTVAHRRRRTAGVLSLIGLRSQLVVSPLAGMPAPERGEVIVLDRGARVSVR